MPLHVYGDSTHKKPDLFYESTLVDPELLMVIKNQLISLDKRLVETEKKYHQSSVKKSFVAVQNLIKQLCYISGSITIGGVPTGIILWNIIEPHYLYNVPNQIMAGVGILSGSLLSTVLVYISLKFIMKKIGNQSYSQDQMIKDNLVFIEQILNKLSYEVKKIERLLTISSID